MDYIDLQLMVVLYVLVVYHLPMIHIEVYIGGLEGIISNTEEFLLVAMFYIITVLT